MLTPFPPGITSGINSGSFKSNFLRSFPLNLLHWSSSLFSFDFQTYNYINVHNYNYSELLAKMLCHSFLFFHTECPYVWLNCQIYSGDQHYQLHVWGFEEEYPSLIKGGVTHQWQSVCSKNYIHVKCTCMIKQLYVHY